MLVSRPLIGEVPLLDARSARGEPSERRRTHVLPTGVAVEVEHHHHRGWMWHCPGCARRTRLLHLVDGDWGCRICCRVHYPMERQSKSIRRLAQRMRRLVGAPRTLAWSEELILRARIAWLVP